jgi:hypothetical protein
MNNGGLSWIYKTNDGGLTWFYVRQESESLSRLAGFKTIYAVGGNGLILKTDLLQIPKVPGYIYGPDKSCIDTKSTYFTGSITGMQAVTYTWTLTSGGTHSYTANSDTVTWTSAGIHKISVSASNACGVSAPREIVVDVTSFQPTITVQDSILTATEGLTYQWYRYGIPVSSTQGGNSKMLVARTSGSYTVTVKSTYGCTATTAALIYAVPVSKYLLAFSASLNQSKTVDLNWLTAFESVTRSFIVERREPNGTFKLIDSVKAVNRNTAQQPYLAQDKNPINGINYYRLRINYINGNTAVSDTVSVLLNLKDQPTVHPNPVRGPSFTVVQGKEPILQLVIYDSWLRKVRTLVNSSGLVTITVSSNDLQNGLYYVEVYTTKATYTQKVIITR